LPVFDDISDSITDAIDRRDVPAAVVERAPSITTIPPSEITPAADLKHRDIKSWGESVWSEGTANAASLYSKATAAIPIPSQAVAAVDWLKKEGHELSDELVEEAEDLTDRFENLIEDGLGDFAQVLGIHDFYSAHILNFCEGFYVPGSVPNDTVRPGTIHKNVTHCSNKTATAHFNPAQRISQELNESTGGFIDLETVEWPEDVQRALNALKVAQKATFVLYCLAIGFAFLAMVAAVMGIFFNGWMSAAINIIVDLLGFLTIVVASALVTFIAQRATHFINKYGDEIGISANRGNKFLALTWSATGLMFLAFLVWIYILFTSARQGRRRRREMQEKHHG
jgi:hypothetical protein